jgi:hypothetical protein
MEILFFWKNCPAIAGSRWTCAFLRGANCGGNRFWEKNEKILRNRPAEVGQFRSSAVLDQDMYFGNFAIFPHLDYLLEDGKFHQCVPGVEVEILWIIPRAKIRALPPG